MNQTFTIIDYRIKHQSKTIDINYEVRLIFKDKNPLFKGDIIVNVPGDKWLVINSKDKYVIVMNIEKNTEVRSMLGQWEIKGQYGVKD